MWFQYQSLMRLRWDEIEIRFWDWKCNGDEDARFEWSLRFQNLNEMGNEDVK